MKSLGLCILIYFVSSPSIRASDPAPLGAISFFQNGCPAGWERYGPAAGRAIVPTAETFLGRTVGEPLLENEQPVHQHEGDVSIRLVGSTVREYWRNARSRDIASAVVAPLAAEIGEASSNLPTLKLNPCRKAEPASGAAPTGMMLFFGSSSCPVDWSQVSAPEGRILAGAEPDGLVGPFGAVRPLSAGEDRLHSHSIRGPADLELFEETIWSGCSTCSHRWALKGNYEYRGQAKPVSSGLPYLQLRACSKDAPSGPQISRIAHGADFNTRSLAVGQHATVFGQGMGPVQGVGGVLLDSGRLAGSVAGVEVLVDGIAAPLFFVRDDQINFQVPYELVGRSSVSVVVSYDGKVGPPRQVNLAPAAPALFTWGDDPGRVVAVYADGSLNGPANAATSGRPFILFATGEGQTIPPGATGLPSAAPLAVPLANVELWIGGEPAVIDYAGAAPGFVGLMQINARTNTSLTGRVPVVLRAGRSPSVAETSMFVE